ncbi:MerR family transcriptional regulator [Pseudonocardia sp. KRD-184]|uniref:MerR family transcriptional regulator n=1 Tax=Pseudonocardia oceani TaxID=2792013 RepID=A0ABS6UE38_9PSEU|nr:MerR family transcriptional regulator [Pseudonocardia oceani]MBW0091845.1 MerR family transcriptional regulator [Pseudonocardia oceani]MBW0098327.1 MerR family transcriptional regulator [Pseudonocardia oceani]MBW0110868.1 MerR family transcriptional regulator [Pseudonocardia oceani]MBW0121968.1 MerR family transcriptional regulator [Pseudonocardia oceani]MBW0130502.1 MerR family transcriptional regulator [Pseudonocardia oceani]
MSEDGDDVERRTIDELARVSGVTVRNIRAYQARGLLPPPEVRARTGYYGPGHAARLELIQELQGEGVKLDVIKKLLDTTGGSTEQVVRFIRAVRTLFAVEDRQIVTLAELVERFSETDPNLVKRAQKMGLLTEIADGTYEETSPRLMEAAQAMTEMGIPMTRSLDVVEQLRRHADGIAKIYVDLFLGEVWQPFDAEGRPDDQWPRLYEVIGNLRKVSGDAMLAVLELAVAERLDVTFGRDIVRNVRTNSRPPAAD